MQKNRTAVAAGILALALIVGGFALWNNRQATDAPVTVDNTLTGDSSTTGSTMPTEIDVTDEPATTNETGTPSTTETQPDDTKSTTGTQGGTSSAAIPETHTVLANETLRDIAKHYYGDPIYSADIERVNNLEDANKIVVGSKLTLPRREELNNAAPTTAPMTNETDKDDKADNNLDTTPTN